MAYSLIVNTSNFKPYDFNLTFLILKEVADNREHNAEYLDTLTLKVGDLASSVLGSVKAKEIYDDYINRLKAASENFDSRAIGINKEIGLLRRLYGTLIRQLEKANEARAKAAAYILSQNKDNTYLHENLGSLDDWMENPNRVVQGYSGTLLTNEVGVLTKAASNDIVKMVNAGHLTPYTLLFLKQKGFSSNDVNRTVTEVQQGGIENVTDPIMRNILTSAMNASGIYNWADAATRRNAENIAARGLYQGIGQADITTGKDEVANKKLDYEWAIKLEEAKQNINGANKGNSVVINPSNIYSAEEAEKQVSNIKNYEKYFTRTSDGKTKLNVDGIKKYNKATPTSGITAGGVIAGAEVDTSDWEFKKFIDDTLNGKTLMEKKLYGNLGNLYNLYKALDFLKYDITGLTEYNHNIDPSEYTNWKDRIAEQAQGYLEKVTWDKNKKAWVANDNDRVSIDEVYKNSNPTSTLSSIYGRTVKMVDKEGKTTRYRLPIGINSRAEKNIENQLLALNVVQQLYTQLDNKTGKKTLTVEEADYLNKITNTNVFSPGVIINKATLLKVNTLLENALATFESQLGLTNTNKPLEWNAIGY